jgi:hypothetical protein
MLSLSWVLTYLTHLAFSSKLQPEIYEHPRNGISVSYPELWVKPVVGLDEVLRFYAERYIRISNALADMDRQAAIVDPNQTVDSNQGWEDLIGVLRERCEEVGLRMALLHLDQIVRDMEDGQATYLEIANSMTELRSRIADEISLMLVMRIPAEKAPYYEQEQPFGEKVATAFPSTSFDIEEASKCYAVGRDTACVFHLMRILEQGLHALAVEIGVAEVGANWNKLLDQMDGILRQARDGKIAKPPDWKERERFYSEASALLRNVKNAWRNDAIHIEQKYTDEEALRILMATKAIMQFLADNLRSSS